MGGQTNGERGDVTLNPYLRDDIRSESGSKEVIQQLQLIFAMVVLFFLAELEGVGMDIARAVDHMGVGEKGNPAYVKYKQGEKEPFRYFVEITHHTSTNIGFISCLTLKKSFFNCSNDSEIGISGRDREADVFNYNFLS